MGDSQDIKGEALKPIKSLNQLVASYFVAKIITEIREEREKDIKKMSSESLPKLNTKEERYISLYNRFAKIVNYNPIFCFLVKSGMEDMIKYNFKEDPSVIQSATKDIEHLEKLHSSSFATLSLINLEEHTLNVFEEALNIGEKKGRVMQTAIPMIASIFHDFGKSSLLRDELIGNSIGKGYRAHAEVSEIYVREKLGEYYHNFVKDTNTETLELIAHIVKNHHPSIRRLASDSSISFVIQADNLARKKEMNKLKALKR